jgi:hypothetical protein
MQKNRKVRLISKRDRTPDESPAKPATPESKEREMKTVISRWVSEHRLRSEEVRRTFTTIFGVTAS